MFARDISLSWPHKRRGGGLLRTTLRALALVALVVACCPALAATVSYVYDALGRLIAQVDSQGATLYSYDPAGNLTSVSRTSANQLSIVSFTPARAKIGDAVTILGTGFFPDPAQNSVSFNGSTALVSAATTSALVVTVPAGATDGPITVTNARGSATSTQAFVVLRPATVDTVSPSLVSRGKTTRIQISGSHLASARSIGFSDPGLTAVIVTAADTLLTADLKVAGTVAFGTYPFSITNDAGVTASGSVTITVTPALLGDVLTAARPASVHLPAVIPGAPAGNSASVAAPASVHLQAVIPGAPAGNSLSATGPVSVHLRAVIVGAPSGNAMSATEPVSVALPAVIGGAPAGDAMSATAPVSVHLRAAVPGAPAGDSMSVTGAVSVSMP